MFEGNLVIVSLMIDRSESVHAHKTDVAGVIETFRKKGYVLRETADPTIIAQAGFVKLIFIPEEDAAQMPAVGPASPKKRRGPFFFL